LKCGSSSPRRSRVMRNIFLFLFTGFLGGAGLGLALMPAEREAPSAVVTSKVKKRHIADGYAYPNLLVVASACFEADNSFNPPPKLYHVKRIYCNKTTNHIDARESV